MNGFFRLTPKVKLSPDFKRLCLYNIIISLAGGMIGLFLPIFLLREFNYLIVWVIIFYLVGYALYSLLVPFGAMWMQRIGLKKSMIIGRVLSILFYICLYFLHQHILLFVVLANIVLLAFRLFYWVPYHVDFAKFTDGKYRGRQMAYFAVLGYLMSVGGPLLSGLILSQFSFKVVFAIVTVILLLSLLPLRKLTDVKIKFDFSYRQTFREVFKKQNRKQFLAYMADGAQDTVGIIIWPIFIYQLLQEQYLAMGALTALIVIGTVTIQLTAGKYTDKITKRKLVKVGSFLYASGWVGKALVATAFQIFVVGTFHSFMAIILRTPFDALRYEEFNNHGTYVDEYTVLREISLCWGRSLMCLALIVLISAFGLQVSFILAAAASLLVNLF